MLPIQVLISLHIHILILGIGIGLKKSIGKFVPILFFKPIPIPNISICVCRGMGTSKDSTLGLSIGTDKKEKTTHKTYKI